VLLLKPAHAEAELPKVSIARPVLGETVACGALCIGTCSLTEPAEQSFVARFERQLAPLLRQHGAELLAQYVTDASENTFPRLPVREGEQMFVWLARFADVAALDAHLTALRTDAAWQEAIVAAMLEELRHPPELQRLMPTARSELR
jgi:hypothetical protein